MRTIGALAGLVPAAMVGAAFVVSGSTAVRPDLVAALAAVTAGAMASGWLVGPLVGDSVQRKVVAVVAYALAGSLLYTVFGSIGMAWTEAIAGAGPGDIIMLLATRLAYGLLYLPIFAGFLAPVAVGWLVAVRLLQRRARVAPSEMAGRSHLPRATHIDPDGTRRLALLAAGFIVLYGLFVGILPLLLHEDPRPPWWLDRPIALIGLFSVPAIVALIGAMRGVRPLLAAAGAMCLLQAFIAFSGVTLGFVIPGMILLAAGAAGSAPAEPRPSRTVRLAGVLVVVLIIGAWTSLLGLTAPRCYVTSRAVDGTLAYTETPATESALNGPALIIGEGGGCGSGELTAGGMALAAAVAAGAIAVAWRAAAVGRITELA